MAKSINDAFGGQLTTLEEQRAIWAEALHEDAIWEGPMFERPVQVIGREATGRFFELLLSVWLLVRGLRPPAIGRGD